MAGFPGFYPQQESYYDGADPWDTPFLPGGAQDSTPYIGSAVPPIQAQQEDSGFNFLPGSVGSSIYDAAKATGVRPQFAMGIANNESSFLPTAFNKTPGSTSQGLFGMTDRAVIDANDYATAHMQPLGNPDRTDPLGESLRGTNYLRMMLDKNNGDEFNAAYDFNQGMNAPDNRPAGDVYANNALNFLPGGKIQTASLKSTGPSGGFGVGGGGGGGSEDTSPSVNQGANERIKMITALQSQASDYKKKALEAQTTAYAPSTLSKGDVFGAVGVPLIATIIGAAMNGKKGAKGGALAGFQGAGLGLKVAEAEAAKKSQLAAEQAKYYNSEGKDLQNQAQSLQSQEFQAQDINQRYGASARPSMQRPSDVAYEQAAKLLNIPVERLQKEAPTQSHLTQLLAVNSASGERLSKVSEKTAVGVGDTISAVKRLQDLTQNLPNADISKIGAASQIYKSEIEKKGSLLDFLTGNNRDKDQIENNAFSRAISALDPNSPEFYLFTKLREVGRAMAIAKEVGVLTERDVQFYYDIFTPRKLESNESFSRRIGETADYLSTSMANRLNSLEAGKYNVSGLKEQMAELGTGNRPTVIGDTTSGKNKSTPPSPPAGAIGKMMMSDGKKHFVNSNHQSLGVAE